MSDPTFDEITRRLQAQAKEFAADQAQIASRAQRRFLEGRMEGLRQMGNLVRLQAELAGAPVMKASQQPVLFDRAALEEFAAGSVEDCLGPDYAVFQGRRLPRIPNGVLLLMDRVLVIQGERGRLSQPSEIVTEYDVPVDAWFYQDTGGAATPYSILMEMALQPCGFLSAYLGTMLISPESNLYFRNLDGEARILRDLDLRGRTVRAWARMYGHTVNEDTVIQKFQFRLEVDGQTFYEGDSVFGFFPEETMLRQVGLDGGKASLPEYLKNDALNLNGRVVLPSQLRPDGKATNLRLAAGKLALLDEVYLEPNGGAAGQGYIYATRKIHPEDWYFTNHFFQDPVMPGSLGVEAILEAMRAFAIHQGMGEVVAQPVFKLVENTPMYWKYRGQILQTINQMILEVHIQQIINDPDGVIVMGDASLWADRTRIYHLRNGAIRIAKG